MKYGLPKSQIILFNNVAIRNILLDFFRTSNFS